MSGITPILDTLLHQVLGKRVDIPTQRDLAEPVKPVWSAEGPRAVRSDSRLEPRDPSRLPLQAPTARDATGAERGQVPLGRGGELPASAAPVLSQGARMISSLLAQFPSPPSVIRAAEPLLPPAIPAASHQVADRLQSAIRDSGLFYESQVARWYRGEVPRQQLELQPQMARFANAGSSGIQAPPAATPQPVATAGATASAANTTAQQTQPAPVPVFAGARFQPAPETQSLLGLPRPAQQAATASAVGVPPGDGGQPAGQPSVAPAASESRNPWARVAEWSAGARADSSLHLTDNDAPPSPRSSGLVMDESLQSLVRHQLEMLVAPVVRWEGDVWAGIFMALVVRLPEDEHRQQGGGDDAENQGDDWQSSMSLELPSLGAIQVSMSASDARLRLRLAAQNPDTRLQLEAHVDDLRQRLVACGFHDTVVTVTAGGDGDE